MAATCSLIAGRSPRRRISALVSVAPSRRPAALGEDLERLVAGLVVHLGAAGHPVAEIDVRQAGFGGERHVVEDDVAAEAVAGEVGVEEGIDHRHAVREDVGQADRRELPRGAALRAGGSIRSPGCGPGSPRSSPRTRSCPCRPCRRWRGGRRGSGGRGGTAPRWPRGCARRARAARCGRARGAGCARGRSRPPRCAPRGRPSSRRRTGGRARSASGGSPGATARRSGGARRRPAAR